MKYIIVQIVDNDNRNNSVKFEKDSPFCFWVFQWQSLASRPIEIDCNLYFTQYLNGEISLNFACITIVKIMIFQIKILNEINLFLIIIFKLLQFKIVCVCSLKFLWTTAIQNALLLVN